MTTPRHNIATSAPRRPPRLPAFNSRGRPARACRARGRAVNAPCLPQCLTTQESGPTTPAGAVGRDLAALSATATLSPARQPLVARSVRAGASCAAAPMTKNSAAADQVARCSATNRFMIMTSSSAVAARRPCIPDVVCETQSAIDGGPLATPVAATCSEPHPHRVKNRQRRRMVSSRCRARFYGMETSAPLLHFRSAGSHDDVANVGDSRSQAVEKSTTSKPQYEDVPMKLPSQTVPAFPQSRPILPCAQCGEALFAPEWSEYFDDRRIRHCWSCDACDYQFETMVCYPAPDESARAA